MQKAPEGAERAVLRLLDRLPVLRFRCLVGDDSEIDPLDVGGGARLIDEDCTATRWRLLLDRLHPDDAALFRPPDQRRTVRRRIRLRGNDDTYRGFDLAHAIRVADAGHRVWEGVLVENHERTQEARLMALTERLPGALYRCEVASGSTRCSFVSPAVRSIFGVSAAAFIRDFARARANVHPDDLEEVEAAWYEAAARRTLFDREFRIVLRNRRVRWIRSIAQMSAKDDGTVIADGIAIDVTRHRILQEQLERRNRELLTLSRISEIALTSPSVAIGLEQMAREISRHMNFPTAVIAIYDESEQVVTLRGSHNVPHLPPGGPARVPIGSTLAWEVIRTGRPLIETDALSRSEPRFTFMHKGGHQTFVGVPIKIGGQAIGCLGLGHPDRLDPPPAVIELLSSWADSIASFIASKGHEELASPQRPNARTLEFEAAFASRLTARQREVLAILAHGRSNRAIAQELGLQEATVKIHVRAILRALGVRNRTQAATLANAAERGGPGAAASPAGGGG